MLIAYLFGYVLAVSTVLGRSPMPPAMEVMFEDLDVQTEHEQMTAVPVLQQTGPSFGPSLFGDDRLTNLKFVMALQRSNIWTDVKKRSMTINTEPRLDEKAFGSPEQLTDQELARLKQVCHDGLKCVAVDRLLVLKRVEQQLDDGKTSVRTAITKITKVLAEYTDEYDEHTNQYEEVKETDDSSKVYDSITTIVEDNRELCRIDETVHPKVTGNDEAARPKVTGNDDVPPLVNNGTVNFRTVNNFNVNNGTVNAADINVKPSDSAPAERRSPVQETPNSDNLPDGAYIIVVGPESDNAGRFAVEPRNLYGGAPTQDDRGYVAQTYNDRGHGARAYNDQGNGAQTYNDRGNGAQSYYDRGHGAQAYNNQGHGAQTYNDRGNGAQSYNNQGYVAQDNGYRYDNGMTGSNSINLRTGIADNGKHGDGTNTSAYGSGPNLRKNSIDLRNGQGDNGNGENDTDLDIASAGWYNNASTKKGYVEDGSLNNGMMKSYNLNNGTINKGSVQNSNAGGGIINVGTVNNGPVNYGTVGNNNGKVTSAAFNGYDVNKFVSSLDDMYSSMLKGFA